PAASARSRSSDPCSKTRPPSPTGGSGADPRGRARPRWPDPAVFAERAAGRPYTPTMAERTPQTRRRAALRGRTAAAAALAVLLAAAIAVLWRQGGFAAAADRPPQRSGSAVGNDLYTLVPERAELVEEERLGEKEYLVEVHARLESREESPQRSSLFLELMR